MSDLIADSDQFISPRGSSRLENCRFPNGDPSKWAGEMRPDQKILENPCYFNNVYCIEYLIKQFTAPFKALAIGAHTLPEGHFISRAVKSKSGLKREQMHISAIVEINMRPEYVNTSGFDTILRRADARNSDTWKELSDNAQNWQATSYNGFDLIYVRNPSVVGEVTKANWLPIYRQAINNLNPGGQIVTVIASDDYSGFKELKSYLDQDGYSTTDFPPTEERFDWMDAHTHVAVTERCDTAPIPFDLIALPA